MESERVVEMHSARQRAIAERREKRVSKRVRAKNSRLTLWLVSNSITGYKMPTNEVMQFRRETSTLQLKSSSDGDTLGYKLGLDVPTNAISLINQQPTPNGAKRTRAKHCVQCTRVYRAPCSWRALGQKKAV